MSNSLGGGGQADTTSGSRAAHDSFASQSSELGTWIGSGEEPSGNGGGASTGEQDAARPALAPGLQMELMLLVMARLLEVDTPPGLEQIPGLLLH